MKKINTRSIILGLVLALAVAGPAAVVSAIENNDSTDDRSVSSDSDQSTRRAELQKKREAIKTRVEEKRTSLQDRRDALKTKVEERHATIKKSVCTRRQAALEKRIAELSKRGSTIKSRIDSMYEKVVGFYEKGQLTVEDYAGYIEKIETAKASAATSLDLIASQSFTFDCESDSLGGQLDSFRLSIKEAKTPLKEYRKTLVDLISAMRAANGTKEAGNE